LGLVRHLPSFSFSPLPLLVLTTSLYACIHLLTLRFYYEKKFDECKGVIQPEMALPMGIPGAFCLPVSVFLVTTLLVFLKLDARKEHN
jgi:hypothetical protein